MSAKYKSPSFLLPNEINTNTNPLNTDDNPATGTGINSLYSMDFDSTKKISNITGLGLGTSVDTFSISLWFYKSNMNYAIVFSAYSGSGTYPSTGVAIDLNTDGTIAFYNGANRTTTSAQYNINTWYNLVVTSDGTTVKMYVNGSQVTLDSTTVVARNFTNAWINSAAYSSNNFGITGKIDEVAIFNRALTDGTGGTVNEIAALYEGTGSNIRPSNLMATDLNPIAYYPLGEQAQNSGYPSATGNEWQFPNGVLQDYVMDFDGSDNINSEANISSASSFTASVWINRDDSNTQYIYGQWVDGTSASQSWVIQTVGGIVYFNVRDASLATKSAISTASLTTGVWYNIIAVWTGSNIKLYINNSLEDTTACTSMNNPSTAVKLAIGSSSNNVSPFNGKISNAVIWNSDQESNRDNIYNNGSPQTTYTVTPQNWWKLNADSVYTPSAPNYTTALDFGGTDYIDCGVVSAVENVSSFSMSVWVYPTNGALKSIIGNWGNPYVGVEISTSSGAIYFTVDSDTAGSGYGATSTGLSNNNWAHLVLVFDGSVSGDSGRLKGYINGVEQTLSYTGTIPATTAAPNRAFRIGDQHAGNGLIGNISNAAIWNTPLSASQVSTLFNFGTPETNISFSPISWWKLDNTTTGIQDSGSASNNGTNNGATDIPSGVAVTPSWKIPSALPITTTPNYTTALEYDSTGNGEYSLIPFSSNKTIDAISLWYNSSAAAGTRQCLISFTNSFSSFVYPGLFINEGSYGDILFTQKWTSPNNYVSYNGGELSGWNNLVINYNASTLKYDMYLNGLKLSTSTTGTGTDKVSTNGLLIGNRGSLYVPFKGFISNLCIFNSSLNETGSNSIETIYNSGTPLTSMPGFTSLDGWWTLKDTSTSAGGGLYDSSSNGNNSSANTASQGTSDVLAAQPVNGVSTTLPSTALQQSDLQFDSPYSNYSLSFDGSGDYIDCGAISQIPSATALTVSCWLNTDSITTNQVVWADNSSSYIFSFEFAGTANKMYFEYGSPAYASIDLNSVITVGSWHHVVMVYDASGSANTDKIKFYIDGVDKSSSMSYVGSIPSSLSASIGDFLIGYGTAYSNYFNGKIDETSIFNYSLSEAQVLEIYNNGRPNDLTTFSGTAPISWWRLGENAYFNTGTTPGPEFTVPNSISGAPNGTGSGTITTMISADAPGTYANGIGTNLDILDRVGDAALSTSNSQSYNMIPSDKVPYVPGYVGDQISNTYSMSFDGVDDYINTNYSIPSGNKTISFWFNSSYAGYQCVMGNTNDSFILGTFSSQIPTPNGISYMQGSSNKSFGVTASVTDEFADGNWHHFVYTYDGNSKIYIDGTERTISYKSGTISSDDIVVISNLALGLNRASYPKYSGKLDEVAIFDTALNAGQIYNDIYQPTATGTNQTADLVNNPNLPNPVAWYRMGD